MASVYYGLDVGQGANTAVAAATTNSTDVEIRMDKTNVASREALLEALINLQMFILEQPFPAA